MENWCKIIDTCIIIPINIVSIKFSIQRNHYFKYDNNFVEIISIIYSFLKTVENNYPQITVLIMGM